MNNLISILGIELNPVNDARILKEYIFSESEDVSTFYATMKPIVRHTLKPVLRGGISGAIIGVGIAYFTGTDIKNYSECRVLVGMIIDSAQIFDRI